MEYNFRSITYNILFKIIYQGAFPDLVLKNYFNKHNLSDTDRRLTTETVYGVLRWKRRLEYIIKLYVKKEVKGKKIDVLLLIGVYQLLFLDSIPDYAAINETVKLSNMEFGKKVSNFINAVLREISRNKNNINYPNKSNDFLGWVGIYYSYPQWLLNYWTNLFNMNTLEDNCHKMNLKPDFILRTNYLKSSRTGLLKILENKYKLKITNYSKFGMRLSGNLNIFDSIEYKDGLLSIQDESSQIISLILDPKPGETILDACSAPGTKSMHIAEMMGNKGQLLSCDLNKPRLRLVEKDAKRLGINIIKTINHDARYLYKEFDYMFDRILVDAPCSGFGTIRKNPDLKWNKSMKHLKDLAKLQLEILEGVSKLVKKGGILVYSVCTISYLENQDVYMKFLKRNKDFIIDYNIGKLGSKINRLFDRKGYFSTFNNLDVMDGFFAVRFKNIKHG